MMLGTASAQKLVLEKSLGAAWGNEQVGNDNKANGRIYRLREDVRCKDLPRVPEVENLELIISEPISIGWLALYRLPLSADNYKFVVVLYNHDKQPLRTLDLCRITANHYCEVQDVRWDPDKQSVLFNMACPSYASEINGQGSKLYSISMEGTINWESTWLVSNDIFILDDQFVYCAYGFTSEKDYIYLLYSISNCRSTAVASCSMPLTTTTTSSSTALPTTRSHLTTGRSLEALTASRWFTPPAATAF